MTLDTLAAEVDIVRHPEYKYITSCKVYDVRHHG